MATVPSTERTPVKSLAIKAALAAQVFLLRKNIAGPMGDFCMVVEHRGRKTGNTFATPIAYLRDGADLIAISGSGRSNWFKNTLANGEARINIKSHEQRVTSREITDAAEIARVFELYKTTFKAFQRTFGVRADASEDALRNARDRFRYLRLTVAQ